MDKYSKEAFKITLALLLSLTGFTSLIGLANASPPYPWDYGRKTQIWHEYWWVIQWRLTAYVWVQYSSGNAFITSIAASGSASAPAWNWNTYGYSYIFTTSARSDHGWTWAQMDNSAHFKAYDDSNHIIAYATCRVEVFEGGRGSWCYNQLYGPFIWIVGHNIEV